MYTKKHLTRGEKAGLAADAVERLEEILTPGQSVYCLLRHVSSSGMSRRISFFVVSMSGSLDGQPHGRIEDISYLVARLLDYTRNQDDGGLVVRGCGMDMGFAVVNDLSSKLAMPLRHEWL